MADCSISEWRERRAKVAELAERLSMQFDDELVAQLAPYANDTKWEIRKAVADALLYVPPDRQFRFMPLLDDQSRFVRAAAASAMRRAGAFAEESGRRQKMNLDLFQKLDRIRESGKTGAKVVDEIDRIYRRQLAVMLSAVGHDIRNILLPIVSNGERAARILEQPLVDADQRELARLVGGILERSKMMEAIADDIRMWSKPTPAAREVELLADMLRQAHSLVMDFFASVGQTPAGIVFTLDVPQDMQCRVAREAMVRVFQNLIKNAYEAFMQSGRFARKGEVVINARRLPSALEIDFRDTGRGMSEEELTVVRQFRPCGISKKQHGTGLGMAIACAKVRDHNGNMSIKSRLNEGTTVTVFLPDKGEER